uniref:AlNc14C193G8508 protein n=1 Tax=Albugo laibachii Nc14 TaxID=890382 RepID=F0WQ26_9STRA|nr:AlNc14C193G8508 [Albugo laibachii Nc14]|eukprot:CCA23431.1 AlNc14C193G8508 [Albugo laibachii Nc14]
MSRSFDCHDKTRTIQAGAHNACSPAHPTLFLSTNTIFASAPSFQVDKWIELIQQSMEITSERDQESFGALQKLLEIEHFGDNPRSSVYLEYIFHGLQFAREEMKLATEKIVRFMSLITRLFEYAVTPKDFPGSNSQNVDILSEFFPSLENVYDLFRQMIHESTEVQMPSKNEGVELHEILSNVDGSEATKLVLKRDSEPIVDDAFTIAEVAHIVNYMTSTFFRQLSAYQYVFARKRKTIEERMDLIVELPLLFPPLSEAGLLSKF